MIWPDWTWAHPERFLLALLPAASWGLVVLLRRWRRRTIPFTNFLALDPVARMPSQAWRRLPAVVGAAAFVLLAAAAARPLAVTRHVQRDAQGIDIVIALDVSESMHAHDIQPNRLTAAKRVLDDFIQKRPYDRIGAVVFAGASFSLVPLTTDRAALRGALGEAGVGTVRIPGTALGEGILTAVNRLIAADPGPVTSAPSRTRVVILATDGVRTRGVPADRAARIAAEEGVRIYTIGLGGGGRVARLERDYRGRWVPMVDAYGKRIYWEPPDLAALRRVADITQGRFFEARDREGLEEVLATIDNLETQTIRVQHDVDSEERYAWFLWPALALVLLERLLTRTRFKRLA